MLCPMNLDEPTHYYAQITSHRSFSLHDLGLLDSFAKLKGASAHSTVRLIYIQTRMALLQYGRNLYIMQVYEHWCLRPPCYRGCALVLLFGPEHILGKIYSSHYL